MKDTRPRWLLIAALVLMGAGWGLTQPLMKITVDAGYQPFGIVFWQMTIGALGLALWRFRQLSQIRISRGAVAIWLFVALVGTIVPNSASYRALFHLPSGLMSILISTVPILAFPIAMVLGSDRFSWRRMAGLVVGLAGVGLIVLPEASLPERAMLAFVPLALVAPLCYAFEGNVVARFGTAGLGPITVLLGASALGAVIALPLALASGQFFMLRPPFVLADVTLLASSLIHVVVYAGYVWMVRQAGAVFAGQIAYLVTATGVLWAILILNESYSGWVWAAMALMLLGMTLVKPRGPLETNPAERDTSSS